MKNFRILEAGEKRSFAGKTKVLLASEKFTIMWRSEMRIVEAISISIAALRSNKLRSLLTMLGIIIGVASVLAMIAIGDGAKAIVQQDVQKLGGANQFIIYRRRYKRVNNRWVRNRSSEYLKYGDVLAMEAECPTIKAVTPQIWNRSGVLIQAPGGGRNPRRLEWRRCYL